MQAARAMMMLLGLMAAGAFAAEGSFWSAAQHSSKSRGSADAGVEVAQLLPFERNKIEPIDPKAAFLEGYNAYKHRDLIATIGRMQFAASRLPDLADYAIFYLASAERDNGDGQAAASDFRRLTISYPQSVWSSDATLEYARLQLKLGYPTYALTAASEVVSTTNNPALEQNARLTIAYALLATSSWRSAYSQLQIIRQKFPTGPADQAARELTLATAQTHPAVISVSPLEYHRTEAALLVREGQDRAALNQIRLARALAPPRSIEAELSWLCAEASRGHSDRVKAELQLYLELAPHGPHAARALNWLAHLYWHENDTASARLYFNRLAREFADDELGSQAMFEIGRTYEEDGDLASARTAYLALAVRYPGTEIADDGRFRAAFMLYMLARYRFAAAEFGVSRVHAGTASAHDMFTYWQARALENSGEEMGARRLFEILAASTGSNYYPTIAAMRLNQPDPSLPAASAPDLVAASVPADAGPAQFHLARVAALRDLGLRELEPPELRAIEPYMATNRELQTFVLAELQNAGAWFDAIEVAMGMSARGELDPATAERIRYPRGYWIMLTAASSRNQLDPYLVAALIRQESLFNPQARSSSDARGLMQLLPVTAERYAPGAGITNSSVDLYDPAISLQLGTAYLHNLMGMFGGNLFRVVAAYNAGEHSVAQWNARYPGDDDQWVENIGFRETREYVKKVIGGMREYRLLYGARSNESTSIRIK